MANHVRTTVEFHQLSEAGEQFLQELYNRIRTDQKGEIFSDIFVDGGENSPTYEEAGTHAFFIDNVGSKWCFFEDRHETGFTTESAWSWPDTGVDWVFEQIAKVDPDYIASVVYEDEMPNFAGIYVYNKDGIVDGWEEDFDEIRQRVISGVEGLSEEWNEDEEEFTDEGYEMFSDNVWEIISQAQYESMKEIIEELKEDLDNA